MIAIISQQEAKQHLRVTSTHSDDDIELKILAASAILLNYIKIDVDASPLSVPWGEADPPWDIKASCMLILGELYMNREAKDADVLSPAVRSLLHRYRDPALA